MIHYPSLSSRQEPQSESLNLRFLSRGYFQKYSHFAIPAKLHGPKGDRINQSLLYTLSYTFRWGGGVCAPKQGEEFRFSIYVD